jgi:gamma-tubulin complex component 5
MVLPPQTAGYLETDATESFIHKLQLSVSRGLPNAAPVPASRTEERELVRISLVPFLLQIRANEFM